MLRVRAMIQFSESVPLQVHAALNTSPLNQAGTVGMRYLTSYIITSCDQPAAAPSPRGHSVVKVPPGPPPPPRTQPFRLSAVLQRRGSFPWESAGPRATSTPASDPGWKCATHYGEENTTWQTSDSPSSGGRMKKKSERRRKGGNVVER